MFNKTSVDMTKMYNILDFKAWLTELCCNENEFTDVTCNNNKFIKYNSVGCDNESCDEKICEASIYTMTHVYTMTVIERINHDNSLTCHVNSRSLYDTPHWYIGKQLIAGHLTKETWEKIKIEIIKYELTTL